ncbi:MAG: hypothetical protein LQ339_008183 [Xanthoria mediterranea]|nr:MAG: hypothetical protein LQ339_008183 [Xanthoria mediterranea]
MSSTGALGPLETLLLLQGLQVSGPGAAPFATLSETLKARDASYHKGSPSLERFEPKSLELLYLRLLREEAKSESQQDHRPAPSQDGENDVQKTKLSSPPLETMEEAWHYRHLIPQLATRVYDSHRESAIKAIESEERRYQALRKDVQEIERGEWDARLQIQEANSRGGSKSISSIQTLLQDEPNLAYDTSKTTSGPHSFHAPPLYGKDVSKTSPSIAPAVETQPQNVVYANGDGSILPKFTGSTLQNTTTPAIMSPKKPRQSLYLAHQVPSNTHKPPSQPTSAENGVPYLPPPHHPNQGYGITSPAPELNLRPSSQPANIAPSPNTRPHPTPRPQPERSSGSPIILPPPPGMLRSTSSASGPLDPLADMPGNQYRPNAMPSPRPPHAPNGSQHAVQLPLPPIHAHKSYQYPQYDNRPPYQNTYGPYHPGTLPPYQPQSHPHVAPYQHSTHHPGQQPQYPSRQQYQSPAQAYPQYSSYGNAAPYNPQHGQMASPYGQYPSTRPFAPQTPVYASESRRKPKPSPINTSVSSTKWKKVDRRPGDASPKSPIPPGPDEISPISEKAPSPVPEPARSQSGRIKAHDLPSLATEDLPTPRSHSSTAKRGRGRPRGSANRVRGNRAASIASSALPARSRSPSIASAADELSLGAPTSAGNRPTIKPEPPATPARDSSASVPPSAPTDDGSRKSTRRRRGTLRGLETTAENARISTKRKRTMDTSERDSRPLVRSELEKQREELSATHILASRNFPRTSATLMNDISAHKLASIFAKPLTQREAPGYPSLIYRSQDLKSIKQAITIGNRALTAFIEQERDENGDSKDIMIPLAGGAGEGDARIWVPKSDDFLPPKGIVNSAQLEKEIMRVFANAVMFNPDPQRAVLGPASRTRAKVQERHVPVRLDERAVEDDDGGEAGEGVLAEEEEEGGVVRDTREMFEDVERIVGQWRAAERAAEEAAILTGSGKAGRMRGGGEGEEEDADELAGEESGLAVDEEEVGERAVKRRRR